MRKVILRLVMLVTLGGATALLGGCGRGGEEQGVAVPLEQVPAPFVSKAKEVLPEVHFENARKLANGNYEIRGKDKRGKVREVEFTPSGQFTIE